MTGKRVLVVDDNPGMVRLITLHLERDSHLVTSMKSSLDALAAFDAGARFDVYVLDVRLQRGEPHGLALAKMLEQRQPSAAFVFVTGDPDLEAHSEFFGRVLLAKPLDFAALRRAVAEAPSQKL
jgi:two-component system response regulator GlrR